MALAFPSIALLSLWACEGGGVPAMPVGGAVQAITRGEARIVFVRPASACDTNDHPRIVDDHGHFVGALGPETWFEIPVAPGPHVFFVWPEADLRTPEHPDLVPVDVVRIEARPGVRYLGVAAHEGLGLEEMGLVGRGVRCWTHATYRFFWPPAEDAAVFVRGHLELVPDAAEGQARLAQNAELTRAYFDLSEKTLAARDRAHDPH